MSDYIKGGLKVLGGYGVGLVLFLVFIIPVLQFKMLVPYSIVMFILSYSIIYQDMKKQAQKDKRAVPKVNHYPLKGLMMGLVAVIPFMFLEGLYFIIRFDDTFMSRTKHLTLNTLFGPIYGFIKMAGEARIAYILMPFILAIVAGAAYFAGYKGFDFKVFIKKHIKI